MNPTVVPWHRLSGPRPAVAFHGDGCTGVSERIAGKIVTPACDIHDWEYHAIHNGVQAELQADLPANPIRIRWNGPGAYVPLHGEWIRWGDEIPIRWEADWRFGGNTAVLLRDQGVSDIRATTAGIRRFLGVRLLGKHTGWKRWVRVVLLAALLAGGTWWAFSWLYNNHPIQAAAAITAAALLVLWDQFK